MKYKYFLLQIGEGPWSAKFILRRPFSFQIYFAKSFFVPNLFCFGDFRSKFILRFDFLNITVRHEIGKRYNFNQGELPL